MALFAPVAVAVYVVVVAGETPTDPAAAGCTTPILLSILMDVASLVVHERVDVACGATEVGLAESVQEGAGGGGVVTMCTVVWHTAVPPGPVAVPV